MSTKISYANFLIATVFFLFPQTIFASEIEFSLSPDSSTLSYLSTDVKKQDLIARKSIRGSGLDNRIESVELHELRKFDASLLKAEQDFSKTSQTYARSWQVDPQKAPAWLKELMQTDSSHYVQFHERVVKYLTFYKEDQKGRSILTSWFKRQGRYRDLIEQVLEKHHLPSFLLYVSMIESGYDPHDYSSAGAVGLWQFMPEGAKIYGLRVDYWVDERKDPVRSTEAAAQYLADLKKRFGSWHLALAAFNAGYGAVIRSLQKYNTNNYWQLCRYENGLPLETVFYVPKAIATALVGENRKLFGYDRLKIDAPIEFEDLVIKRSMTLEKIASVLGVKQEKLAELNPHLRRGRIPPLTKGESYVLHVPKLGKERTVLSKKLELESDSMRLYTVRFGERLEDIAKRFRVSVSFLKKENGIEESADVRFGVSLLLPTSAKMTEPEQNFVVEKDSEHSDFVLVAVPDKDFVVSGKKRLFYQVIYGDTLSEIAQFFKVKLKDLATWNHLDLEANLATKMVLDIWVDRNFDTRLVKLVDPRNIVLVTAGSDEFLEIAETLKGRKRIVHSCTQEDTLEKIANKYHFPLSGVERINGISRKTDLEEGQKIIVYQPMTAEEQKKRLHALQTRSLPKGVLHATLIEDQVPSFFKVAMVQEEQNSEGSEEEETQSLELFPMGDVISKTDADSKTVSQQNPIEDVLEKVGLVPTASITTEGVSAASL